MKKIILALVLVLSGVKTFAAVDEEVKIQGIIEAFSDKDVTLIQDGKKYLVPRAMIPKDIKIEPKKQIEFTMKFDLLEQVTVN